jgi:replicative superfamily II helicase
MRYIITESQYKILVEQTSTDNWLYDWFKNVPEDKIKKTFSYINSDILSRTLSPQNNVGGTKRFFFSKPDLLKLISQRPPIQTIDSKTFDFINADSDTGALYINSEIKTELPSLLGKANDLLRNYEQYASNPEMKQKVQKIKKLINRLEMMGQYAGKIIVPSDLKTRIASFGIGPKEIKRHEEMHSLYDMADSTPEGLIKRLCPNPRCKSESLEYVTKPTEIYSYLMTLRSKLNMMPIDVVQFSKITKGDKQTEISIVVNRDGKEVTLRDYLPNSSATIKSLECCTGDLGNSIKLLHNNLAMNDVPKTDNLMA